MKKKKNDIRIEFEATYDIQHMHYLHHFQFLRVRQISGNGLVSNDIILNVDVGPINQPFLHVRKELQNNAMKCTELFG